MTTPTAGLCWLLLHTHMDTHTAQIDAPPTISQKMIIMNSEILKAQIQKIVILIGKRKKKKKSRKLNSWEGTGTFSVVHRRVSVTWLCAGYTLHTQRHSLFTGLQRFRSSLVAEGLDNICKALDLWLNLPNLNVILPVARRGQKRMFSLLELKL